MKIGYFLAVLFFILLPTASAVILLDDLSSQVYNFGDKIEINGYLLQNEDSFGMFRLDLNCAEASSPLLVRALNVKRGEQFDFKEELPLIFFGNNCKVVSSYLVDNAIEDQAETTNFEISTSLLGNFSVRDSLVQSGKDIAISGRITKHNGDLVNGIAIIYFIQNGEVNFVDTFDVEEGNLNYVHNSENNLPGKYQVNIEVNDIYGNKETFENAVEFSLVNEVSVFVHVNKESALPGTSLILFGEASTILQEKLESGVASISLGLTRYETKLKKGGQFDQRIELPEDIGSGRQIIEVVVIDAFGNRGEAETFIDVIPIPTMIELKGLDESFKPGAIIIVEPLLFDQAGALMSESVNAIIYDSSKDIVFEETIVAGGEKSYTLSEDAVPGSWKVVVSTSGISSEKFIQVGELVALGYSLDNETLVIRNVGNVKYDGTIEVLLRSFDVESSVAKKARIKPNEELRINLGREVEEGNYDIIIGDKTFENIYLSGRSSDFSFRFILWILVGLIVIIVIYFAVFNTRKKIIKKLREQKKLNSMQDKTKKKENMVEDYKKEFKNRMLKQIEERDRAIRKKLKFKFGKEKKGKEGFITLGKDVINKEKKEEEKKDDKKRGGLFSMFD